MNSSKLRKRVIIRLRDSRTLEEWIYWYHRLFSLDEILEIHEDRIRDSQEVRGSFQGSGIIQERYQDT